MIIYLQIHTYVLIIDVPITFPIFDSPVHMHGYPARAYKTSSAKTKETNLNLNGKIINLSTSIAQNQIAETKNISE